MSITNELREYADTLSERARYGATIPSPLNPHSGAPIGPTKETEELYAIADCIDAEHEKAIRELNNLADAIADSCVQLQKDTGGEYIHEHDKVDWRDHAGTWHENATVVAVCNDGCYVMDGTVFHVHKSDIRHHREPTVEDVLREFALEIDPSADIAVTGAETIKKFAAKLQLRGDTE